MKNMIMSLIILFLLINNVSIAMEQIQQCMVFIGNPGVGKSTLVNSLINKPIFKSGISVSGVTKVCQIYEHGNVIYVDTPGLSDIKLRNQAAIEIEKTLKKNAYYKIFFVFTLEAGRLKPEDINTVNRVMDAIKNPDKKFNIIINKVTKQEKKAVFEEDAGYTNLCSQINNNFYKTDCICYIDRNRALEDNETQFVVIDERISKFVYYDSYEFYLDKNQVKKINPETAEELQRKAQAEEDRLRNELEQQRQRNEEIALRIAEEQRRIDDLRRQQESVMCRCCRARLGLNF